MRKTYPNSRLEIWNALCINSVDRRMERDKNVDIVQIECTYNGNYIVEIVDRENKEG